MVLISLCANSHWRMLSVKEEVSNFSLSLCLPLMWGPNTCQESLSPAEPASWVRSLPPHALIWPTAHPTSHIRSQPCWCTGLTWFSASVFPLWFLHKLVHSQCSFQNANLILTCRAPQVRKPTR